MKHLYFMQNKCWERTRAAQYIEIIKIRRTICNKSFFIDYYYSMQQKFFNSLKSSVIDTLSICYSYVNIF